MPVPAPNLTNTNPLDNAIAVAVGSDIVLTFSVAVSAVADKNLVIYKTSNNSVVATIAANDNTQISIINTVVTVNPTADLDANTEYYVLIDSGAFARFDGLSGSYAGIASTTALSFTTAASDTTAPTLVSSTPADEATAVAVDGNIVLTFSENVQAGSGKIYITDSSNGFPLQIDVTDAQVTINNNTVTINPTANLTPGHNYHVQMASGVLTDTATTPNPFAGINDDTTLNFTTAAPADTTAPTLDSSTPADDATAVAVDGNIVLTFNENVQAGMGQIVIVDSHGISRQIYVDDTTQVTINNNTVTINPTDDLASGTTYYVQLESGALTDMSGNNFAGISGTTTLNFTTADTTAPVIASAAVNGSTLVLTYTEATTLDAIFVPAIDAFAVSNNTVTSVDVSAANKTVTLTLGTAVANGDTVTVSYTDPTGNDDNLAIQDAAGNDAATITDYAVTNDTPAVKSLAYSATTFVEAVANDGSITTTSTITLTNDTFTGNDNADWSALVTNEPAGLTASLIRTTATTATLSFTGSATAHANANDISNLSVTFADGNFTGGSAAAVTNATKSNLVIDFSDPAANLVPMLVKDIVPGVDSPNPLYLTNIGGTLYFRANDGTNGVELWTSDGTAAGTKMVKDINTAGNSNPSYLADVGGTLYFQATNGTDGTELWKSDGTEVGTEMVANINTGGNSAPSFLTNVGGTLYFTATNGTTNNGNELWKSDGTTAEMVKDIKPGVTDSNPNSLTNVNGTLYFKGSDSAHGAELWKSTGTADGTEMVKDIKLNGSSSEPNYLTNVNGTLYFTANDGTHGVELWKSNGTTVGTEMVEINTTSPGAGSSPMNLTAVGNTLYFTATDGTNGTELWKSTGTTTEMVANINTTSPGAGSSPSYLTAVGTTLYLTATDGTNGYELWKSDGTTTEMVKNINTGGDSNPNYLTNVNGTLYFLANDSSGVFALWKSDGTAAGTVMIEGTSGTNPSSLTNVDGTLYFTANDGTHGKELWKLGEAAAALAYSETTFAEAAANNGSITTTSTITLTNDTFTGSNGDNWSALVSNVPAGLTASLLRSSATTATLSFTGSATAHANVNDVSDLTVTFADGNFTGNSAAAVTGATTSNLVIDFADPAPNAVPTLGSIPGSTQQVTTAVVAALPDFTVADTDGGTLTVTLAATNGTIGGLTDADPATPGIQLTGTAAQINTALADALFTATAAGAASIGFSLSDGVAAAVTATYNLNATAPVVNPPVVDPPVVPPVDPPVDPPVTPPTDDDNDGITATTENQVPTLPPTGGGATVVGDGNGDGVADNQQSSVTSVPFLKTDTAVSNPTGAPPVYVTLVADSNAGVTDTTDTNSAQLTSVQQKDAPTDLPADIQMPLGLISFVATIETAGITETFSLFVDSSISFNGYWKQNTAGTWCNIATAIETAGGKTRIDFAITDGGEFDADGKADGIITDPGAIGSMPLSLVGELPVSTETGFWF